MAINRLGGIRLILRLEIQNTGAIFSYLATAIGAAGGDILAVDLIQARKDVFVLDVSICV